MDITEFDKKLADFMWDAQGGGVPLVAILGVLRLQASALEAWAVADMNKRADTMAIADRAMSKSALHYCAGVQPK